MKFFTSDWHLGGEGIIKYANRNFKNADIMSEKLIRNCNKLASQNDTVYHVGDFLCHGRDQNFSGTRKKPRFYLDQIKSNFILFNGNHDENNRVKPDIDFAFIKICKLVCNVCHFPTRGNRISDFPDDPKYPIIPHSIRICGHVHQAWKYYYDDYNDVLNINVGVDQWDMQPVGEVNLHRFILKIIQKHNLKYILKNNGCIQ